LLDRRLAELRRGAGDELFPERARVLVAVTFAGVRGRGQVDQVLLEPERLQLAPPGRLSREHHAVAALAQHVADTHAVVRRPVGALRHEQDGQWPASHGGSSGATITGNLTVADGVGQRKAPVSDGANYGTGPRTPG